MSVKFDLTKLNLAVGTHNITVKARANGYEDSEPSNAAVYTVVTQEQEETVQVSGTWYFNEVTTRPNNTIRQTVAFTSNGMSFNDIFISNDSTSGVPIRYGDTWVYSYGGKEPNPIQGWQNQAYRTITFDGVQTVSKEFYDWLTANAVQQTLVFTIDGTTYYADPGMTWGDWVESKYNTDGFTVDERYNSILLPNKDSLWVAYKEQERDVKANELIIAFEYVQSK
jgi:hypothetical protein